MTVRERQDLAQLVRRRERLAKAEAAHVAAERMAEFELKMATVFDPLDLRWRELYEKAGDAVVRLNAEIAEQCKQAGIPAQFAPLAEVFWLGRGENYSASRRVELRAVARTRIAAEEKRAKAAIEQASVEIQTQLVAGGLESEEARTFLEAMPTAQSLMPSLTLAELEAPS